MKKTATREEWLINGARALLNAVFKPTGFTLTDKEQFRVSVGFPHRARQKTIGQCWGEANSADKHHEIFIHPKIDEPLRALDILTHELIHIRHGGHKASTFGKVARAVGLEGKLTATVAGEELMRSLKAIVDKLGPFPHGALTTASVNKGGKEKTYLKKVSCPECGYTIRVTAKWLAVGVPTCPCGTDMQED